MRLENSLRKLSMKNFGKGYEDKDLPFMVYREYSFEMDDYVVGLSSPPATEIYKYIWQGKYKETIDWQLIVTSNPI